MNVHVRYFAGAREATGLEGESLELAEGCDIAALLAALTERHAGLAALAPSLRFALGESFCAAEAPLADGDEVALLPPVGGG